MDLITGKGPSKRRELLYFAEGTLRRYASTTLNIASLPDVITQNRSAVTLTALT